MNSVKINPPEGFVVDEERSTTTEIFFKPNNTPLHYWETISNEVGKYTQLSKLIIFNKGATHPIYWKTSEEARAWAALYKLIHLRNEYNKGWIPDYNNDNQYKYVISSQSNEITLNGCWYDFKILAFRSGKIRDQFYKDHKQLIEQAKTLL